MSQLRELVAGATIAGLGLLVVFVLIPQGVVEPSKVKFAALSPSYYPRIVGWLLVIAGIAIIAQSWFSQRTTPGQPEPNAEAVGAAHPKAGLRLIAMLIVLIAFAALLEPLGFVLTSALVLLTLLLLGGERSPKVLLTISTLAPILLFYFFLKVPRIPFPNGVLSGLLPGT